MTDYLVVVLAFNGFSSCITCITCIYVLLVKYTIYHQ